jgi:hypothetical protein
MLQANMEKNKGGKKKERDHKGLSRKATYLITLERG